MSYKVFAEIGRVALVNYGKNRGQLVTIVNIVDSNRALVDSPNNIREIINFKRLALTNLKIAIPVAARHSTVTKAWAKADVENQWAATSWARKLASRKSRANLNDFDRFKVMLAKKQRNKAVGKKFKELKKASGL